MLENAKQHSEARRKRGQICDQSGDLRICGYKTHYREQIDEHYRNSDQHLRNHSGNRGIPDGTVSRNLYVSLIIDSIA